MACKCELVPGIQLKEGRAQMILTHRFPVCATETPGNKYEGGENMNYTVPISRVIRTSKQLKTVCKLSEQQRQIRDYCRTHLVTIKLDKVTKKPYAVVTEKTDV